jgi:hypothetical protein
MDGTPQPGTTDAPAPPEGVASPPPLGLTIVAWIGVLSVILFVMMRWFARRSGGDSPD